MRWPWSKRKPCLEKRVAALEEMNVRVLGILENISQTMDISREAEEMQTAIRDLKGQIPVDRGDLPDYIW